MNAGDAELARLRYEAQQALADNRPDLARRRCSEITALNPADTAAWHMLSAIHGMLGEFSEAEACARKVVALAPAAAAGHTNLGTALLAQHRTDEAILALAQAIALAPSDLTALNSIGNAYLEKGDFAAALAAYQKALALKPDFAEARNNIGNLHLRLHRPDDALRELQHAVRLRPGYVDALCNIGKACQDLGRYQEALDAYNQALHHSPGHFNAQFGIADTLYRQGKLRESVQCYEKLLQQQPDHARLLATLADIRKDHLEPDEAIRLYRRAVALDPGNHGLCSNYLMTLNYRYAGDYSETASRHRDWGRRLAALTAPRTGHDRSVAHRPITVGLVSHDFRTHSVAYFLEPFLTHYDRSRFRVICYANMAQRLEDTVTQRFRAAVDAWRDITATADAAAADLIAADGVDILVDLAGHTAWNRLPLFAMRPAPVQVSWLGYPNTTGLETMDYRITDAIADPPGRDDDLHTETLLRLPDGFLAYRPPDAAPATGPPPALLNGHITFGSFNTLAKIGPETIARWCRLLHEVAYSRLVLKNASFRYRETREKFLTLVGGHAIDPQRISLHAQSGTVADHLALYGEVDIALDTFPYNGTTTSCEALWMGVPVVTRCGEVHASRVTASILHRLGLDWLAADSWSDYIDIAAALAADEDRRTQLRTSLRPMLAASPLGQHEHFTRTLEAVLQNIWDRHLEHRTGTRPD